jgi:hypothetical protein
MHKELIGCSISIVNYILLSNSTKQEHYMHQQMYLLGDNLTTPPSQLDEEISIEQYPN